jgi:hypothetical protein
VFARWGNSNPFSSLRQLDGQSDAGYVREALLTADVIHCHVNYMLLQNSGLAPQPGQVVVRHYHGSIPPDQREGIRQVTWIDPQWDEMFRATMVGARLTLVQEGREVGERLGIPVTVEWLPIAVPVARYRMLSAVRPVYYDGPTPPTRLGGEPRPRQEPGGFRIAHCPTKRSNKGTDEFLKTVDRLNERGLKVIPVLIERDTQARALERKRTCDATFDSFWLGIQTSGLEAGAMGMPCIAGDPDVAALYREALGEVPYTFANDGPSLERVIEQLITDRAFYEAEAERVARYTERHHDYAAVGRRYEEILAKRMGRSDVFTTHEPAAPRAPSKPRRRGKVA